MSAKENKDLMTRYIKEMNAAKGDVTKLLAIVDKYSAPDFVWHLVTGDMNFEQTKQFMTTFYKTFPDASLTIDDIVAEGDKVVTRSIWRATHKGRWLGVAPTGRKVSQSGISIYRIAGGKMVEGWSIMDTVDLMIQLGAMSSPYVQR